MASAYELMLVLRGRNYLSNDLRRAGSDLRRLQTQGGLQAQRSQLQVNAQRLASTRAIAQAEVQSITTGARRLALTKAISANETAQANALQNIRRIETQLEATESARLRNAANLSRLSRRVQTGTPQRGFTVEETKQLRDAAAVQQRVLAEQAATQARQLEIARQAQTAGLITTQQLIEREADLAHRQEILTDKINTTTAAEELNTRKLNENALAVRRLPFERLAAGARYVEHLGRTFQTLGFFATAALGLTAHSASEFSTQATLAATQATIVGNRSVRIVQQNSRQIQAALQQMLSTGATAVKPTDLTQGLYSVYSGITLHGDQKKQIQDGIDIIKQFSRVYTANYGQVEFNDIVRAGIALINSFGLNAQQLPGVLNRMQASVRFGAMTMSDFVGSLNQVVPAYKSAHLSFDNLAADVATVSRLFPNLRFGTTGLARLLEQLGRTDAIQGLRDQLHIDIAPQGRLRPLLETIQMIAKARPELTKGGVAAQNFFKQISGTHGTIQARRVFAQLISSIGLYRTVSRQTLGDNKELTKSFTDMSQTPQVRWAEFTNQLRGLVLEVGTHALPVFAEMAGPIENAVHWFDNLDDSTKRIITRFAVWGSIGLLVGGTMLVVAGAIGRIYAAVRILLIGRAGIAALEDGFITVGTAMRVGIIGAIILAIPLLVRYHTQIGHIINRLGGLKTMLQLISVILTSIALGRLINSFVMMALKAQAARLAAAGVMTEVEALAALGPIEIPIVLTATLVGTGAFALNKFMGHEAVNLQKAVTIGPGQSGGTFPEKDREALAQRAMAADTARGIYDHTFEWYYNHPAASRIRAGITRAGMSSDPLHDAADRRQAIAPVVARIRAATPSTFNLNAAIANVEALRKTAEKSPSVAHWLAYEKALSALQKRYKGDDLTALNDYLNSIESAEGKSNRKRLSAAEKAARARAKAEKDAQKEVLDAAKTLQDQYQSIYQTNQQAFGTLFEGPLVNSPAMQNRLQYGGKLTGRDLLGDIRSQVARFRQWRGLLTELRKRGITGDLYDQIVASGPGSIDQVKALLSLSKADLRTYARTFQAGESLIAGATQQDMNLSLTRYRKYGRNIALQIIQGLRDEHTPVLKVFEDMILKDFPGLARRAHPHRNTTTVAHNPVRTTQSAKVEHHTHYHVTAPKSEHTSVTTQLRHAAFVNKHKHLTKPLP